MNVLSLLIGQLPGAKGGSPYGGLFMMVMIIVVFYFFMIRPQMKRQKDLRTFREALKKGDKVVTTGGVFGKITAINDRVISLEIADGVVIKINKDSVLRDTTDINQQQQR